MPSCIALIVAGGRGARFGGSQPKQYAPLGGKTVLYHTVQAILASEKVDRVRVVIHPDDEALYESALKGIRDSRLLFPVHGGGERQDSVRLGLESLQREGPDTFGPDLVLIHDAARPFVDVVTIERVIDGLATKHGAIPALPVVDTLKSGDGDLVGTTVDRAGLFRAQTPQGFHFHAILRAHQAVIGDILTDDAAVAESQKLPVALVAGTEDNFKITTPEDLMRAERQLPPMEPRTGQGFDVHAFADGDHVTLCGVQIPHDKALKGHSDADVAMHALTDALYGSIGAGDIGHHFPPSDPQWKGAASAVFLEHACAMIKARGGRIANVDITIICETPKVGPHREDMRSMLSAIMAIDLARVSVKATTSEKLGFTGRGEGIAAQALASVLLPSE